MKITHEFEYDADYTEIADEFCNHDSDYQAEAINSIGLQFYIWSKDKTRTATYTQLLEIAEQLNEKGKWFIETLCDYMSGEAALEQGSKMLSEIEHLHKYISKLETQIVEQESVLDKIRVEIEALEEGITSYHNDRPWIFKDEVLAIIDKYKAESEDVE